MEHLKHDPTTKQQIKTILYKFLYDPVIKHYDERLADIVERNTVLGGYAHRSFLYRGELYNIDVSPLPRMMNKLVPQLQPAMNAFIKDKNKLNSEEIPYVVGYIQAVLNASNDLHDYLRLLPESLHSPIMSLINTCLCRTKKLTDEDVEHITEKNKEYLGMMRERMVHNTLF